MKDKEPTIIVEKPLLIIKELEKTYVTKSMNYSVLQKVEMTIHKGEFVSIMGQSGSGKTTLLNIISGFLSADSGEIILEGRNIFHVKEDEMAGIRQSKLGFIFQDFMLIDSLTAKENIFLPQIIAEKNITLMEKRTNELLDIFGIVDISDKYPNEVSGGQKQRIAISRALANEPSLVLADEPTGNLDSKSSDSVIKSFLFAKEQLGTTILMVTHDVVAASHADRIIVLSDGRVVQELKRTSTPKNFVNEILKFMKETNNAVE